jgi:teichuronic acid biosynthesis glycosyltransferase TuaC
MSLPLAPAIRSSEEGLAQGLPLRVLTVSSVFPNAVQPVFGTFVLERVRAMARMAEVRVAAPVAWFPDWFRPAPYRWRRHAGIPHVTELAGVRVFHPRRLVIPRIGRAANAQAYRRALSWTVRAALAEAPIDIIDAHFVWPDGHAAVEVGREFGIPVSITGHGSDLTYAPQFAVVGAQTRTALRHANQVLTVSRSLARLAERLGADPQRVAVVPNGVDLDRFRPPADRRSARRSLGLADSARLVVGVGALVRHKGFDAAIEALATRKLSGARAPLLVLVGDGPERRRLQRLAEKLRVAHRVRFCGSRSHAEVARWMGVADALLLPSHREGWPTVLFEAWACGTPIVATPVHGVPEAFDRPGLGILLRDRMPETVADALATVLAQRWDPAPMRAYASSHTWDDVARRTLGQLRRVAGLPWSAATDSEWEAWTTRQMS